MQFPGMMPLQYLDSPTVGSQLPALGKALQGLNARPGAAQPPTGPAPMDISPAATNAGTNTPQPSGILAAIRGMQPQGILDMLKNMTANGQQVIPQPIPGMAALQGAGMLAAPPTAGT